MGSLHYYEHTYVFKRHKAFSGRREVNENLPHASRPSTAVNGIREIAENLNISCGSTKYILASTRRAVEIVKELLDNIPEDPTFTKNIFDGRDVDL